MAWQCDPTTLPLESFVELYGQSLPLRVRVEAGFYGNDQSAVISSGDIYNFHFTRKEKAMAIRDSNGTQFSIPFNSAISFGLIYNPLSEPDTRYSFASVGEIITCKYPPRIIRATKEFNGKNPKTSVKKEELLIVKKICQNGKRKKHHLRVHSLLTGEEKKLCRECEGNFLTDPGSIRLYLPEIAEFFEESLPLYAKIFLNCDVSDDNISCLVSDVVTMTHVAIKTSVIATACWVDHNSLVEIKDDDDQSLPVAIPTDLNIEVSLLEPQPMHDDELYRTTRQLFEGFQSTRIKDMKRASTCTSTSDPMKMLQIKLTHSVREGHERQGVTIEKPNKVYKSSKRAPTNKKDSKRESLEFKPPSLPEAVERTYRERRLSSISYSTFISEQRPKSLKSKPPDGVASPVELPSERSKEYSGSSTTSESFNIQTNAAFEQKVLGAPHSLGWDEESLTANFHGPCDSDEQSTEDSSGYDNYDLPRKLAPQSRSIPQTGVGASYLGPTHMPDRKDTISTGPVIPHVVSSNQYAIGGVTVCPSAAKHVNEEPISLRELGHVSVPTGSDTTYVYDIPPSRVSNRPTARHPQRVQLPLIHSPLPSSCELNISESRLTRRTTSPAKSMSESRCSSDTKPPANLSLTDLIKNHPLLKDKSEEDQNRSVEETLEIPKGCSSFLPLIPRSNNQETSVEHQQLTLTTSTSKVGITMSDPSNCHEDQISLETLDDTQTQTNSISVQLGADKSQSPVKQTQQSKQNSSTCSFREGPATVYSQVVNASMNRAQTLKVRNIQELKKLDCQKVQTLLENMKLGQYKQCFLDEEIDGEILAECDEQILLYELNVSSEMHRRQLMNIITGKQSVALILSGQGTYNNYVKLSIH